MTEHPGATLAPPAPAPAAAAPAARGERGRTATALMRGVAGAVVAVGLWELLRLADVIPQSVVPPTWVVVGTMAGELTSGDLSGAVAETIITWLVGLAVTALVAIPIGVLVGLSRWADASTSVLFDLMRPVPVVALVPVAVVLLGLGLAMQVSLIVLAAVWPLLYNTRYGVRNVDPALRDAARVTGMSDVGVVWRVVLPSAAPAILTGLRLSAGIALIVTVVTELVASGTGLGRYITLNEQAGLNAQALAGVLAAGLLGTLIFLLFSQLQARALSWHTGATRAAGE